MRYYAAIARRSTMGICVYVVCVCMCTTPVRNDDDERQHKRLT